MPGDPDGDRPRRGPVALELMLASGAAAVSVAWFRAWADTPPRFSEYVGFLPRAGPHARVLRPAFSFRWVSIVLLVPPTLALLCSLVHPPRPTRAESLHRPGVLAALIVSAVLLVQSAMAVALGLLSGETPWWYVESRAFFGIGAEGLAVAIGWGLLALCRRWRPSPSWRDRAGRLLGWAWIASWLSSVVLVAYPRLAPSPTPSPVVEWAESGAIVSGGPDQPHPRGGRLQGPPEPAPEDTRSVSSPSATAPDENQATP
ncbi:hypothetical protein [Tautonia plasticadhaerens]|uniref:Uncharacterized protein n=1 Tax=Tautonia plasticadhaerens TaxID=2527974 RepID=A0A518HAV8_9BACT|nr:hypothetical protein [Tautonia plasticadhaerens]QDV37990.1 hypothetical protein ElP_59370 [Tautonia plasticadhaerens]